MVTMLSFRQRPRLLRDVVQEGRSMGYEIIRPPALGTYPTIERSRPLRCGALEECGVRQVTTKVARYLENIDGGLDIVEPEDHRLQ